VSNGVYGLALQMLGAFTSGTILIRFRVFFRLRPESLQPKKNDSQNAAAATPAMQELLMSAKTADAPPTTA
jgi:hypothetical protein